MSNFFLKYVKYLSKISQCQDGGVIDFRETRDPTINPTLEQAKYILRWLYEKHGEVMSLYVNGLYRDIFDFNGHEIILNNQKAQQREILVTEKYREAIEKIAHLKEIVSSNYTKISYLYLQSEVFKHAMNDDIILYRWSTESSRNPEDKTVRFPILTGASPLINVARGFAPENLGTSDINCCLYKIFWKAGLPMYGIGTNGSFSEVLLPACDYSISVGEKININGKEINIYEIKPIRLLKIKFDGDKLIHEEDDLTWNMGYLGGNDKYKKVVKKLNLIEQNLCDYMRKSRCKSENNCKDILAKIYKFVLDFGENGEEQTMGLLSAINATLITDDNLEKEEISKIKNRGSRDKIYKIISEETDKPTLFEGDCFSEVQEKLVNIGQFMVNIGQFMGNI